ncbi:MAG: acyl-CoA thioesterase [Alphaproteobacteria bacterium]
MASDGKAPGFSNIHRVTVLWTDCDPAGINFYGNYFRWMDEASYHLFKSAGLRWEEWRSRWDALGIPLIGAHADFKSPAKFGDQLDIESRVSEWGRSSFTVSHIFRDGERMTAEGWEKRVFCTGDPADPSTFASAPIPGDIRKPLGG